MGLSEKTKRAPSAPVWNQSFPSRRHCWTATPSLSGATLLCHFSRAFPYPPPGDACGRRSAPACQLISHISRRHNTHRVLETSWNLATLGFSLMAPCHAARSIPWMHIVLCAPSGGLEYVKAARPADRPTVQSPASCLRSKTWIKCWFSSQWWPPLTKDQAHVKHNVGTHWHAKFRRHTSRHLGGDSPHTLKATLNYYINIPGIVGWEFEGVRNFGLVMCEGIIYKWAVAHWGALDTFHMIWALKWQVVLVNAGWPV